MSARAPCAIASSTAGRTFSSGRLMATMSAGSGKAARSGQHFRPMISERLGLIRKISPVKPRSSLVCRKRLVKLTLLVRPLAPTSAIRRGLEIASHPARLRRGVQLIASAGRGRGRVVFCERLGHGAEAPMLRGIDNRGARETRGQENTVTMRLGGFAHFDTLGGLIISSREVNRNIDSGHRLKSVKFVIRAEQGISLSFPRP